MSDVQGEPGPGGLMSDVQGEGNPMSVQGGGPKGGSHGWTRLCTDKMTVTHDWKHYFPKTPLAGSKHCANIQPVSKSTVFPTEKLNLITKRQRIYLKLWTVSHIFIDRKERLCFQQCLSVISHSVRGWGGVEQTLFPWCRSPTWRQTPWQWHLVVAIAAVGTHPTGIHSCLFVVFFYNGSYYIHVVKGVPGFPPVLFLGVRDNKTLGSVNSV